MIKLCDTVTLRVLFTPDECSRIANICHTLETKRGVVLNTKNRRQNSQERKCDVGWLFEDLKTKWIFDRMRKGFEDVNGIYGFTLDYLGPIQYISYKRFYYFNKHFDNSIDQVANRKLTMSVQLSVPIYGGGYLDVWARDGKKHASRSQGDAMVFPSYLMHQARPILWGTREVLVGWMCGNTSFK